MLSEVELNVIGGRGGDGIVSMRREKFVPRGGPDGGNGGRGGSVEIVATRSVRVLDGVRGKKTVLGEKGGRGGPQKRHGKNGKLKELVVPVGTQIWQLGDDETMLADLAADGERIVVVSGGAGGKGNAALANAVRRTPRIAEHGLAGEELAIRLELRLLAEAGLIGLPNAGKSSLLRMMSAARPKVGAYPFTTLEPNLGMVEAGYETIVVADIPGLIEGAHTGVGLGVEFLRHIQRTRVLVCVIDSTGERLQEEIDVVRNELRAFGRGLPEKRWIIAANKIDLPGAAEGVTALRTDAAARGVELLAVSAATGEGMPELIARMFALVQQDREEEEQRDDEPDQPPVLRPIPRKRFELKRRGGVVQVSGTRVSEIVEKLGVESEEARAEVVRRLDKLGAGAALRRAGLEPGDRVRVGGEEIEWPG